MFYFKDEEIEAERFNKLKVSQPLNGRAEIQTQAA